MSPRDAIKYRAWIFKAFIMFKNLTKYFVGHEKIIESGASAIFSVVWRKLQLGKGLDLTNIPVAAASFGLTYTTGTSMNSTMSMISKYNNSMFAKMIGITERNAIAVHKTIVYMISWLLSSLRYSTVTSIAEITSDVMHNLKLTSLSRKNVLNYGRNRLAINNRKNITQTR